MVLSMHHFLTASLGREVASVYLVLSDHLLSLITRKFSIN